MSDRPKALRYAEALATAEERIAEALPEIVDSIIARAREGDVKAASYLCDRIMGRAVGTKTTPADDRQPPYSEQDFRLESMGRDAIRKPRIKIPDRDERLREDSGRDDAA